MYVERRKYSRRSQAFADRIEELEVLKSKISKPDLDYPHPSETRVSFKKAIKSLKSRLDTFEKQTDAAFFKTNPDAEEAESKPIVESTTLWDFPTQSYGKTKKGDSKFQGVTPAFIVYNMIQRYTEPGDLVFDPMCGSGTTIDVCREENREVVGMDISPTRPDISKNDARTIPLDDESVDMVFIDSPYGDNVNYSDDPENIGKISAESGEFYFELGLVARELHRVMKPGKVLGWLIGDQWVKRKFTPVGFKIYEMLVEEVGFEPVDLICVARRNQSSNTGIWHYRAVKHNFYLRGFKHLILVRKSAGASDTVQTGSTKHDWNKYK